MYVYWSFGLVSMMGARGYSECCCVYYAATAAAVVGLEVVVVRQVEGKENTSTTQQTSKPKRRNIYQNSSIAISLRIVFNRRSERGISD